MLLEINSHNVMKCQGMPVPGFGEATDRRHPDREGRRFI